MEQEFELIEVRKIDVINCLTVLSKATLNGFNKDEYKILNDSFDRLQQLVFPKKE